MFARGRSGAGAPEPSGPALRVSAVPRSPRPCPEPVQLGAAGRVGMKETLAACSRGVWALGFSFPECFRS